MLVFQKSMAALMLLISASAAASAQTDAAADQRILNPKPAELPFHIPQKGGEAARAVTDAFGLCVVQGHRAAVERALALPVAGPATWQAFNTLANSKCLLRGSLGMPSELMRGSLYAAMYEIDYRSAPSVPLTVPVDYAPDVAGARPAEADDYLALHNFADCVVRADPATSRVLILSPVGSAAESASFAQLGPRLSGCIVQGRTITFSKSILSAIIAQALYRATKAAVAASAAPAG